MMIGLRKEEMIGSNGLSPVKNDKDAFSNLVCQSLLYKVQLTSQERSPGPGKLAYVLSIFLLKNSRSSQIKCG